MALRAAPLARFQQSTPEKRPSPWMDMQKQRYRRRHASKGGGDRQIYLPGSDF